MPELPEVHTTSSQLNTVLPGLTLLNVWTDWEKILQGESFAEFRRAVRGKKVRSVSRRGKNVLIHLEEGTTILIHMKMTGHLLYGSYKKKVGRWVPDEKGALNDPYNRFIHLLFTLSNGKHLAFSDTRKFGKLALIDTAALSHSPHLATIGPEPLENEFTLAKFIAALARRPKGKIKQILMDQSVIAGIGNIYSDEMLLAAGIHPERKVKDINARQMKTLFASMKRVLNKGINLGGDSTSDYRNIRGERGTFHHRHSAYRRTGEPCLSRGCRGVILRKMVGGRSAHFCSIHQPLAAPKK